MQTEIDGRFVHGVCHYNGDVIENFDLNKTYGPNYNGEYMWCLGLDYTPETNKTTAYFSLNPPVEVA